MKSKIIKENSSMINDNSRDIIIPEFDSFFTHNSVKDVDKHEARMIMYRFLSEIERVTNNKRGLKKYLGKSINKSSSFITQLFNGSKIINLITVAKFQRTLGIKFKITALTEESFSNDNEFVKNIFIFYNNTINSDVDNRTFGEDDTKEYTQILKKSEPILS